MAIDVGAAKQLGEDALITDGAHHKQWYIEQMLFALGMTKAEIQKHVDYEPGIAP